MWMPLKHKWDNACLCVCPQTEILTSLKALLKHIDSSQLTRDLEGSFLYDHNHWIHFRQVESMSLSLSLNPVLILHLSMENLSSKLDSASWIVNGLFIYTGKCSLFPHFFFLSLICSLFLAFSPRKSSHLPAVAVWPLPLCKTPSPRWTTVVT